MDRPTVLLVYYSRSGRTKAVAKAVSAALACDVEEIVDKTDRRGLRGYLRSGLDVLLGRPADLEPLKAVPERYDLIIIGTPVWNASVSAPVRTFLERHAGRLPRVAFFLSHGSSGRRRVFQQMERLTGTKPVSTMAVREAAVRAHRFDEAVRTFVDEVRQALKAEAAGRATPPAVAPAA